MTYDNHQFFLCGGACGLLDELGVVLREQVGGERGVQHSAMAGDPRREVRGGSGPMQLLFQLVAFVGDGDTGGGGDGRNLAIVGSFFQHDNRQIVERIDAIDWIETIDL